MELEEQKRARGKERATGTDSALQDTLRGAGDGRTADGDGVPWSPRALSMYRMVESLARAPGTNITPPPPACALAPWVTNSNRNSKNDFFISGGCTSRRVESSYLSLRSGAQAGDSLGDGTGGSEEGFSRAGRQDGRTRQTPPLRPRGRFQAPPREGSTSPRLRLEPPPRPADHAAPRAGGENPGAWS